MEIKLGKKISVTSIYCALERLSKYVCMYYGCLCGPDV